MNWNAGPQLAEAITSIVLHHGHLVDTVIIVDNASTDDSLVQIEAMHHFPFLLKIIRNHANCGFAKACNRGAAAGSAATILFLNPDTRVPPDCLDTLFDWLRHKPAYARAVVGIRGLFGL